MSCPRHQPAAISMFSQSSILTLIGLLCWLLVTPKTIGGDAPIAKEHHLKAAFTFNFMKFVEWPADRPSDATSSWIIGVTRPGPIVAALEEAVKNRRIKDHALIVKTVTTMEEAQRARLLFFVNPYDDQGSSLLAAVADAGVLTIGESEDFATAGGIINFLPEDDRMRFEINLDAAGRARLKISAHLQTLAKSIRKTK